MRKIKVYIASPYTLGNVALNVKLQLDTVDKLMDLGFAPYAPLYNHYQDIAHPRPPEDWINIDFVWVEVCDCLLRLGGESAGAEGEVKLAKGLKKPVFYSIGELHNYYNKN